MANKDAAMVKNIIDMIDQDIALAKEFRDMSKGRHERTHHITVPIDNEVAMCSNIPMRRFAHALLNFVYVGLGMDEASMQFFVSERGENELDEAWAHVKKIAEVFILPSEARVEAPIYPTGTLEPHTSLGKVLLKEPGTSQPAVGIKDAPDNPSIAPRPGDRPVV